MAKTSGYQAILSRRAVKRDFRCLDMVRGSAAGGVEPKEEVPVAFSYLFSASKLIW